MTFEHDVLELGPTVATILNRVWGCVEPGPPCNHWSPCSDLCGWFLGRI